MLLESRVFSSLSKLLHLATRIKAEHKNTSKEFWALAVCLSGLTGPAAFDTVGEFGKMNLSFPSGIDDPKQQRALLLLLAGPSVREIFRIIPEETKGDPKDYKKAMKSLNIISN